MYYKFIFCILTYRNTRDIQECLESIKERVVNYKVIIVNSYYDEISSGKLKKIAQKYDTDFMEIPNKGYGYGNNRAIEKALKKYIFDYLVISNPDVIIKKFDTSILDKYSQCIIAPEIRTINGKAQNPYWYRENKVAEKLVYMGYKKRKQILLYAGFALTKFERLFALVKFKICKKPVLEVYAAHGSFCMFPYSVVNNIHPFFEENMFLFAEESYISHILNSKGYKTIYTTEISILHKENGSISIAKIDENDEARKSVVYYYENYILKCDKEGK